MGKLTTDKVNVIAKTLEEFSSIQNDNGGIARNLTFNNSITFHTSLTFTVTSIVKECSDRTQGFLELIELLIGHEYEADGFNKFCKLLDHIIKLHSITWKDLAELRKICIDGGIIESDSEMEKAFEEMMPSDYVKKESYPSEARLLDLLAYHSQNHVNGLLEFLEKIFPSDSEFTSNELNNWKGKIADKTGVTIEQIHKKIRIDANSDSSQKPSSISNVRNSTEEHAFLLIAIEDSTTDVWGATEESSKPYKIWSAGLLVADQTYSDKNYYPLNKVPDNNFTECDLPKVIHQLIVKAEKKIRTSLGNEIVDLTIEVFLPLPLLGHNIHNWKMRKPLHYHYAITLRSFERVFREDYGQALRDLRKKWDDLAVKETLDEEDFFHVSENHKSTPFSSLFDSENMIFCIPLGYKQLPDGFHEDVVDSGLPVAFWFVKGGHRNTEIKEEIEEAFVGEKLTNLPKLLRKCYRKAPHRHKECLWRDLVLFYDCPKRIPNSFSSENMKNN